MSEESALGAKHLLVNDELYIVLTPIPCVTVESYLHIFVFTGINLLDGNKNVSR